MATHTHTKPTSCNRCITLRTLEHLVHVAMALVPHLTARYSRLHCVLLLQGALIAIGSQPHGAGAATDCNLDGPFYASSPQAFGRCVDMCLADARCQG